MPSSQVTSTECRNDRMMTHEPPKLKTILKTPPKQATNPLQFVKVGPCSLYRTAQEQLQKVQEVKKIKPEVRDDPEDWQSNLDNWKSSRRKRQEHIIERVVEVKKLELEEHDRHRRRSKTFSEMMEERNSRGRKLSMSLAMYHEEDLNDLSDLGIGTSSGKSSISGDTHDDTHSVLSDRDSEADTRNHSDLDNTVNEDGDTKDNNNITVTNVPSPSSSKCDLSSSNCKNTYEDEFKFNDGERTHDSSTKPTADSSEPEEYTYEGAIRGYVSRVSQNIPTRSLIKFDSIKTDITEEKTADKDKNYPPVKVDILKRKEIFEKAAQNTDDNKINNNNNRSSGDFSSSKSIKERLSSLEKQKQELTGSTKSLSRLSGDMSSIRERLSHLEKQATERESKISRKNNMEDAEPLVVRPLKERLSTLEKYCNNDELPKLKSGDATKIKQLDEKTAENQIIRFNNNSNSNNNDKHNNNDNDNTVSREKSSSSTSEYTAPPRSAVFHRSLDSLDTDQPPIGPDAAFERVQSLEELDYTPRYPASNSSAELLNDTDREDSGIHTADVSCSVSQSDEPVEEEIVNQQSSGGTIELANDGSLNEERQPTERLQLMRETCSEETDRRQQMAVTTEKESIAADCKNTSSKEEEIEAPQVKSRVAVEHEDPTKVDIPVNVVKVQSSPSDKALANVQFESDMEQVEESVVSSIFAGELNDQLTCKQSLCLEECHTMHETLNKQIPPLNLASDEEIVTELTFPLGPPTSCEPPKEKPPPPPTDLSDEESPPIEPLKRLNSTRRIKKELRTRRSDFLGIEGVNDDDELELSLARPPDMAALLAEERRIEQLHRRSYDTDSNYEQDSSHERDSGVELGHADDWVKQPVSPDMSQHSRQSSEPFGASVTSSEEDELTKKEREIIEVLEKEEQWRYCSDREQNSDIGEKLADKLRVLEEEKMQLEREHQEETLRKNDENLRKIEEEVQHRKQQGEEPVRQQETKEKTFDEAEHLRIDAEQLRLHDDIAENEKRASRKGLKSVEEQIRDQEKSVLTAAVEYIDDEEYVSGDVLRVERELLQLEQEELKRQKNNVIYREQKEQWQSLQDVNPDESQHHNSYTTYQNMNFSNYRSSMPNLQLQEGQRRRLPPPPIPPAKPMRLLDQRHRDATIRNSRTPSADSIPQQVDTPLKHSVSTTVLQPNAAQQMTKQTLQALSAVPRTRIVKNDQWVQRRKSDGPRITQDFNYQHWLIQEAEQRRISEQTHRSPLRRASQQHSTGTSVPYTPTSPKTSSKPLPDSIIQTITQRIQSRVQQERPVSIRQRLEHSMSQEHLSMTNDQPLQHRAMMHQKIYQSPGGSSSMDSQEKMLSVSGKKKCSHCGDELGRGAAMIIESLRLFYHMECFKCCVCHVRLGDGLMGTDVRVRNHKLHCHNCYSSDDGVKFSCV